MTGKKNTKTKHSPPKLSDAEWKVMKTIWEEGDMAARDIFKALPPDHDWSYNTVKTMLARLVKKGALDYTQVGNSYLYHALYSREEVVQSAVQRFSSRVLEGALRPFLVNFFDGRKPTREEIEALHEMINHAKADDSEKSKDRGDKQ